MRQSLYFLRFFSILLFYFADIIEAAAYPKSDTLEITNANAYPIHQHLYWLETEKSITADSAGRLFLEGHAKLLYPKISISDAGTQNNYWMMFAIQNTSGQGKELFFQFNNPYLNTITVYKKGSSGFEKIIHTGAILPFKTRMYPFHDFVFPISLQKGEQTTYLIMAEKHGEIFSTKPELMSAGRFKLKEQRIYILFGIVTGIMVFNIIINIFLGISLKDRIHYLYALYICWALLWLFSSVGMDYQFLISNSPSLFGVSQPVSGAITMILMAQLAIVFLRLRKNKTMAYRFLNIAKWVLIVALPLRFVFFFILSQYGWIKQAVSNINIIAIADIINILAIAGIALGMVWVAIVSARQGYKPAWFYLAAILYLAFSIFKTCYIIIGGGDMSELVTPGNAIQQGIMAEAIIIFIGIIYRYSLYKKEKKELYTKLSNQKLEMAQRIVAAQEEERKRLAQDLHDDVGATLSSLLLHITNQPDNAQPINAWNDPHNERSITITKKALTDLRNISHDLLPKDFSILGLFQILRNRIDELNLHNVTRFWLSTYGDDKVLSEIHAVTMYRIINELIVNIIKHAKASQANIDLAMNSRNMTLIVEDNGIGFSDSSDKNGIGIKNIHSRVAFLNGEINIDNNRQGTTVIIDIPYEIYGQP